MASNPRIPPVINQIEVHPFNTQSGIRETCAKHGIVVEAYAPLARAMRMRHPKILELSKKYGCSPAQLFVRYVRTSCYACPKTRFDLADEFQRWSLQHDLVTLPKSTRKERLIENASVNEFEISPEDLAVMDDLDEGLVTDWYVYPVEP